MKVSLPCAAALALFPLVSAFPAPTAAPGELDIIKYGLDVLEARELQPRQSGGISLPLPSADVSTSRPAASASSSSSQPPASSSCAYQLFVGHHGSQISLFSSKPEHITFAYFRASLDTATTEQHAHDHQPTLITTGLSYIDQQDPNREHKRGW